MWVEDNINPYQRTVGDCVVRALAKALDVSWEKAYLMLCINGFSMGNVISANEVLGATLRQNGFYRDFVDNDCECYTADDFCKDNPKGVFVLGFGNHVATVIDGNLYDIWDSSQELPIYVYYKQEEDKK